MSVDSNNNVHIGYIDYDGNNNALKYATNASGDWVTSTIDSGDKGWHASIAVDSNNKVHISYLAGTEGVLKYATNIKGYWVTSTIDKKKGTGWVTSIAVDSNNKVHISYYDSTNYNLKYAVNYPLKLLSPNGGETIQSGSTYSITWSAPSEAVRFRLVYSVNSGKTWKRIHSAPHVTGLSYDWSVPTLANSRNKCLVKITGFDVNGKKLETDMSDATFTIGP